MLTWEAFCSAPSPYGLGRDPAEIDALIKESKRQSQELAADPEVTALPEHGEIGRGRNRGNNVTANYQRGNNASYRVRRLKRDRPDIAEALARGEYKSARAAGIAAGFVKVDTPVDAVHRAWAKASAKERAEIRRIIEG